MMKVETKKGEAFLVSPQVARPALAMIAYKKGLKGKKAISWVREAVKATRFKWDNTKWKTKLFAGVSTREARVKFGKYELVVFDARKKEKKK